MSSEKIGWSQVVAIAVVTVSCCAYMHRQSEKSLDEFKVSINMQSARSDDLYKQLSDYRKESDQKFYALLESQKIGKK